MAFNPDEYLASKKVVAGFDPDAYLSGGKAQTAPQQKKQATPEQEAMASGMSRFAQGMRDPIDAAAQLLTRALPESVVKGGNRINNLIAEKTGLVAPLPEGGVDQQVREREAAYQQARQATGNEGIDWARLGGNIVSPANLAVASKIPQGVSTAGRIGSGILSGGAFGAVSTPVTTGKPEDFWGEKAKNTIVSAGLGGVFPAGAAMISPNVRPDVARLIKEGVTPTPGQILGGRAQVIEDKLTSVPLLGDFITSSRRKGMDEFNRAALNRALKPIGEKVNDIGRTGIDEVSERLGAAYDTLLPKLTFKADQTFANELATVRQMAGTLPAQQAQQFEKVLRDQVVGKMTQQGMMSGVRLKEVESELGRLARGYAGDANFDNRQLGAAIGEMQNIIRQTLVRSNPTEAKRLTDINRGYANYARLRDAASRQGALEGEFTPAQLAAAVRAGDKSVGKGNYAKGKALLQDLSDAGKNVLMQKYPDSGTVGRALVPLSLLGAGSGASYLTDNPLPLAAAAMLTGPYVPGGRQATAALLAKRPESAAKAAQAIRQIGPYLTPGLVPYNANAGQ